MVARRASVWLLVGCAAATASAQVLHERVIVGGIKCANGICWKDGRPGDGAAAVVVDGQVVPAPSAGAQPLPDEPVYTPAPERAPLDHSATTDEPVAGGSPERRERVQMDRATGPEPPGKRLYHEPFNPAIFPFKRMTALDAVDADEALVLAERSTARTRLRVVGAEQRQEGRDAFWGSIVIDLEPGRWVPLPSVAADERILAARVEPPVDVAFARDGADNQYVISTAGGRHRLIWLADAPQRYFTGAIPPDLRLADEPRLPQALPAAVRRHAARVLARIGLDARPELPLRTAVDELVAWFRAFAPGDPPRASRSTYQDLALAQKGSCRHRSYAFVITAQAMGIPTRYVENELHVFVEVMVPRVGWRRINLGGALVDEQVAGAEGKVPYRPKGGDPFPQPDVFAKGHDATPPEPRALTDAAAARAGAGSPAGGAAGGGASGGGGGGAAGGGGRSARVDLDQLDREADPTTAGASATPGASASATPGASASATRGASASPARAPTSVTVHVAARDTFRGDRLDVAGTVAANRGPLRGLPIEIYLDGPGGALKVGDTVSDDAGRWRATIEVPRDLPLGDHRVVARTPGDAERKPSHSH